MADNYYNEISSGYNNLYGEEQIDKSNFIFSNYHWKEFFKSIKDKETINIIDLGCGTGISSLCLIKELNKYKEMKNKKIKLFLIDPANELLKKIIIIENGEMYYDPNMSNNEFTTIELNEMDLNIEITLINKSGEELDEIELECDFLFSLTALQNANNLKKIIEIIKQKEINNYIISYLYRGKEDYMDDIIGVFSELKFSKMLKDSKDIYFIK